MNPTSVARPFTVRYAINTNGDIAVAANTLMTCPVGGVETQTGALCANAQAGTPGDDNYFDMRFVDADSDAGTPNSSSAALNVPAGATVLFAGLYWGAALDQGETLPLQCIAGAARTGAAAANPAAAGSALLQTPASGGYVPISASVVDTYTELLPCGNPGSADERTRYQAFADVTSLVQSARGGTYTVGNVQAGTGADRHAGWSLVVAYQDASQPARNLTVFDGFAQVDNNHTVNLPVSGFKTPLTGAVNTQLGIVSYEGDLALTGDGLALNGAALSDFTHPSGNFFNSSISNLGSPFSSKAPDYRNQLGFDASVLAVPPGVVPNNASTADIALKTVGDRYLPGVVWFRTDIYAPQMVLHKTVTDLDGGAVNPGDVLQYDISSTNTGPTSAYDSRIHDAIPPSATYLPGSLAIVDSPGGIAGAKSDTSGNDQAEFDAGANAVHFRIGAGANAGSGSIPKPGGGFLNPNGGGTIAPGESFHVRFSVVVAPGTPSGTQILNTAILSSKDEDGNDYTSIASAPAAVVVQGVADVTIDKSHTGTFVRGQQGTFTLVVSNVGGIATAGAVVIDDTLPPELGVVSASGSGWTCGVSVVLNSLHCERSDPLGAGAAYPPVSVIVNVLETKLESLVNTGTTGGGGETNTANNSDSDTVPLTSNADVAIVKSVAPTTTKPGTAVTYSLVVTNNGPSTARDVKVSDPLPAGMTFSGVTPAACGLTGALVTCSLGDLVKGQSVTITLVAGVPPALAKQTRTNEATVSSTTPDSNLANNKDDAAVTITAAPPSKLSLRKSAQPTAVVLDPDTPDAVVEVVFTVVLRVPSAVDAKDVDVCDTLPDDMVFLAAPGATFSNGRACWHLTVAKAGSTRVFKITAKVDKGAKAGTVTNVVVATAANAGKVDADAKVRIDQTGVQGVTSGQAGVTG